MPELKSTEMFFPTMLWRFALEPDVRDPVNKRVMDLLTRLDPDITNLDAAPAGRPKPTFTCCPSWRR